MYRINNYFELDKFITYLNNQQGKSLALVGSLVLSNGFVATFSMTGKYEPGFEGVEGDEELIHLINKPYERKGKKYDNFHNDFHVFFTHVERNSATIKNLMLVAVPIGD